MKRISLLATFFLMLTWLAPCDISAQNTFGVDGLIHIPSAHTSGSGTFVAGFSTLPKEIMPPSTRETDLHGYYFNFSMFDFVEVGLHFTLIKIGNTERYNNQDRAGVVKLCLIRQNKWLPSISVGSNSLYSDRGNSRWEAHYAVMSRKETLFGMEIDMTLGYYLPVGDHKDYYSDPFGGVELSLLNRYVRPTKLKVAVMSEYSCRSFNYGLRVVAFNHIFGTLSLTDSKVWGWNVGFKTRLRLW